MSASQWLFFFWGFSWEYLGFFCVEKTYPYVRLRCSPKIAQRNNSVIGGDIVGEFQIGSVHHEKN